MSRLITLSAALILCGCGAEEAPPEPPPPPPPPPTIADFAGDWRFYSVIDGSPDTVMSTISGAAGSDWVMFLPDRDPIPLTPTLRGDSLILTSDEYESILREGVMVQIRTAGVMTPDGMIGNLVAAYNSADGQEIVNGTTTGIKQ